VGKAIMAGMLKNKHCQQNKTKQQSPGLVESRQQWKNNNQHLLENKKSASWWHKQQSTYLPLQKK